MSDPTKYDLGAYVATIDSVMTAVDKIGVVVRPQWLADEFDRALEAWRVAVENETNARDAPDQTRADPSGDQPPSPDGYRDPRIEDQPDATSSRSGIRRPGP